MSVSHPLTVEMLEESHLLLIGQSRSGKTYQLRGAIEQLRRADRRVGAIDKVGNHWGLTLSADGKSSGLEFMIFGGKRAMLPMSPDQGAMLGRIFVERNIPAIFDVSQWTQAEQRRWVADFAEAIFLYNEGALHLGVDEAQSWMPINGGGPAFQNMLRIVEQGLNQGIRLMMSVQRLARLDATARGMSPLVLAMRQTSTIDRNAVADLMAIDAPAAAMLKRDLPGLPPGTGFIWDPGNDGLTLHAFPANQTFDSSRTPRHGDTPIAPITVSSALVDELRLALAPPAPISEPSIPADAEDAYKVGTEAGKMLIDRDRRIAELESELAHERASHEHFSTLVEHRRKAHLTELQGVLAQIGEDIGNEILHSHDATSDAVPDLSMRSAPERTAGVASVAEGASGEGGPILPEPEPDAPVRRAQRQQPEGLSQTAIDVADRLMALAPNGLPWDDLLLLTIRRPGSGDTHRAKRLLLADGLVEIRAGQCFATRALLARTDIDRRPWLSAAVLIDRWAAKLRGPGGEILADIAANGPADRRTIGERLGKSPKSGWFHRGVKDVLGSRVASDRAGQLHLHPLLMGEN